MGAVTWTLSYSNDNFDTATTITDWQTATLNRGKRTNYEPFRGGTGTIVGRNPSAQPDFKIGDLIRLKAEVPGGGAARFLFWYVADYEVEYGITSNEDVWTLYLEDYFGALGRRPLTLSWAGGTTTGDAIEQMCLVNPYIIPPGRGDFSTTPMSAQSFTDADRLTVLSTIINTCADVLYTWRDDAVSSGSRYALMGRTRPNRFNQNNLGQTPPIFTDTQANPPVDIAFDRLKFASLTENYFDKVVVEPDGLAAQTAGTGERILTVPTYNQNTTDALYLAQYLLAVQNNTTSVPQEISATFEQQPSNTSMQTLLLMGTLPEFDLRSCVIEFRGVEHPVIVIGEQWIVNPSQTRVTYHLFSGTNMNFLVLDDATFGKLDENKLGW